MATRPKALTHLSLLLTLLAVAPGRSAGAASSQAGAGGIDGLRRVLAAEVVTRQRVEEWLEGEVSGGRGRQAAPLLVEAASVRLRDGDAEAAVHLLDAATAADPEAVAPLSMLGRAYSQLRDYEAAEAALRQAVAWGDGSPSTLVFLGAALWENGRLDEAEEIYERAVEGSGRQPQALAQLGRLLLWRGRYEEAVPLLSEALERQPHAVEVNLDLAEALRGCGRNDEAIAAFEAVVRAAPDLMKARYGLARLLAQRGDTEASREQFDAYQHLYQADQERAISDERWNGALDLARHRLAQNQPAEALSQLEALPETVDVLELRSRALLALGRDEEAVATLQRAVVLDPGRAALRRRLGELRARGADH